MSDDVERAGKGFMSSALLVAAVGAVLLAVLMLKCAPPGPAERPPAAAAAPTLGSSISPERAPAAAPPAEEEPPLPPPRFEPRLAPRAALPAAAEVDPAVLTLANRAEADCGRLAKAAGRWTAQLLVACRPETVARVLSAGANATKIYVLPARVKDDACFRVCYGSYASAKDAAAAVDLPKALRGSERIAAVEIVKVLP